ncbi:MAG: LysR family transcriptional regulator [Pseudomonadota bacterium]
MARHLDLTALRSFAAVADTGGVTKAASLLHFTQSAVSMQIKRLEDAVGLELFERQGRSLQITSAGEQLLGYARQLLALNDEAIARLTAQDYEGEITLGVPHDIIYPFVPPVLRQFSQAFPRIQIRLISASSMNLLAMFGRGEVDLIVTTEEEAGPGGEILVQKPLVWVGAHGGVAWRQSPLPIGFCSLCNFRSGVLRRLNDAGQAWEMVIDSEHDPAVEAAVSADLAVSAVIEGGAPLQTAPIDHKGVLPDPGVTKIILYTQGTDHQGYDALRTMLRASYRGGGVLGETEALRA